MDGDHRATRLGLGVLALLLGGCEPEWLRHLELTAADCEERVPLGSELRRPVVLLNAYYLQEEAARSVRRGEAESAAVEETFAKAAALGAQVVRTWGFNDAAGKAGDSAMQVDKLVYDEVALRGFDRVLAAARRHRIQLILPLGNYWDAYGGARQYVTWAGLPDPKEGDPRFFTDPAVVAHYREHLRRLMDRVNTEDGLRTGDHPAVYSWELLNEHRAEGLRFGELRAWAEAVAATLRAGSPSKWISTGDEGHPPGYGELLSAAGVDATSIHMYPEEWGWGMDAAELAFNGAAWISSHAYAAQTPDRDLWLGEFALPNDGTLALEERRALYRGWFECARRLGLRGAGPWMFANDARPAGWDRYTFYYRDGTTPWDVEQNSYADLVVEAAARYAR